MAWNKVSAIKSYITKSKNQDANNCWYSCKNLTFEEQILLNQYLTNNKYPIAIYVRNIVETRPQRTWSELPEYFRPSSAYHNFKDDPSAKGDFIFVLFDKDMPLEEINSFLETAFIESLVDHERYLYQYGLIDEIFKKDIIEIKMEIGKERRIKND